jgi:hypothetical protein
MPQFYCPYLRADVELTAEREGHILRRHPELADGHLNSIKETLGRPDQIRRIGGGSAVRMFSRWYDDILKGKHVVVVVVSDPPPAHRYWIVTAYVARRLTSGGVEWQQS